MDGAETPGTRMFVVERYLPALTPEGVRAQARREAHVLSSGSSVRHLRTTYLCADELCFSLFEAPSIDVLRHANELSEMPFERITEAVDITPDDLNDLDELDDLNDLNDLDELDDLNDLDDVEENP